MSTFQQLKVFLVKILPVLLGAFTFAKEPQVVPYHEEQTSSKIPSITHLLSAIICPCMKNLNEGMQVFLIGSWDPFKEESCPFWICFPESKHSDYFCKGCAFWSVLCQLKEKGFEQGTYQDSKIRWVILRKDLFYQLLDFLTRGDSESVVPIERTESCMLVLSQSKESKEYLDVSWSLLCAEGTQTLSSLLLDDGTLLKDTSFEEKFSFSKKSRQLRKP